MPLYKVTYKSTTAYYGPSYIQAGSEFEARRKFAGTAFSQGEMALITATPVTDEEAARALRERQAKSRR